MLDPVFLFTAFAAEHYRQGVAASLGRGQVLVGVGLSLAMSATAVFLALPKFNSRHLTTPTVALEGHNQHLYGTPYAGRTA